MESLLDIHTHRTPTTPGVAIENVRFPASFQPQSGRYYSLGIHPWDVGWFDENQVDWSLFQEWAAHPQVLAIGESGMDKCVHPELLLRQESIFTRQLQIAENVKKPIILHNVRSTGMLRRCKEHSSGNIPWIQHGFRGNASTANGALSYDFYLSFGSKYNEEALKAMPLDRLFFETDDSETNIYEVYRRAAQTRCMSTNELVAIIQENIHRVFFTHEVL